MGKCGSWEGGDTEGLAGRHGGGKLGWGHLGRERKVWGLGVRVGTVRGGRMV